MRDYAELARLGRVTQARVTQIMNLLNLAPDIQEEILLLPALTRGDDPVRERHLRPVVAVPEWRKQRRLWRDAQGRLEATPLFAAGSGDNIASATST